MVRLLVNNGADIEEISLISSGLTPLGVAAKEGVEGADVEAKDKFGGTPLYWATRQGHEGHHRSVATARCLY
jgi:ankyrin repeat protein